MSHCRRPIAGSKQVYLKLRDRASYEFALASAAVVLTVAGGKVTRRTHRPGRRWNQALAVARSRSRARRQARERGELSARPPKPRCATPSRRARTDSRSNWQSAALCTPCRLRRTADPAERRNEHGDSNRDVSPIGRDAFAIDGPHKVTGVAQYTSDFHFPGMLYAVPVEATIAKANRHQARYRGG